MVTFKGRNHRTSTDMNTSKSKSDANPGVLRRRLNELDGKTWTRFSISVWDIKKTADEVRIGHPAMFPLELCDRLIRIFTKKGDVVLDPFVGSGSTILSARRLGRIGIGFEIVQDYIDLAKRRLAQRTLFEMGIEQSQMTLEGESSSSGNVEDTQESRIVFADARHLNKHLQPNSVDFVLTSPPYWSIMTRKRTADYKDARPYSEMPDDFGNIEDYSEFLGEIEKVFRHIYKVLKTDKICAVIVMDIRVKSEFIPFHSDIANAIQRTGLYLQDIIIWNRQKEYNNLRPLGYPSVFVVNKIHEYILLFKKRGLDSKNGH